PHLLLRTLFPYTTLFRSFIPNVPTGGSYQIELTNGQWYSVPLVRIRAKIINGKIFHEGKPGVYLYAAGSGSNPSKISYNVSYSKDRKSTRLNSSHVSISY